MAKLPVKTLKQQLDHLTYQSDIRPYLGGSLIGHTCSRYVMYSFWWAYEEKYESRLWRIFRLGDAVEEILWAQLCQIGHTLRGNQLPVSGYKGHASGRIDGIIEIYENPNPNLEQDGEGEDYLFEAKSMNHTNFLDVQRKGVQVSKPIYYSQCQIYMGKLNLDKALFIAMDKNTSDVYIEIIDFDEEEFYRLVRREEDVIDGLPLNFFPKISNNPSWYTCKFCPAKNVCHHGETPNKTCRTCEHSEVRDEGVWYCTWHEKNLTIEEQKEGCDKYQIDLMWVTGDIESEEEY